MDEMFVRLDDGTNLGEDQKKNIYALDDGTDFGEIFFLVTVRPD